MEDGGNSAGTDGRLSLGVTGSDPSPWRRGTHEIGGDHGRPALMVVPDVAPSDRLPVLVFFHGAGGDGRQSLDLIASEAVARGIVVVAPTSEGQTWDLLAGGLGPDVAALQSTLRTLMESHPVDTAHLALGGFSDGASYALSIGLANGDAFSHLLAFSPGFAAPPTQAGAPSVFVSHGVGDDVLPIDATSRRLVPNLEQAGYQVTYEEFDGGHGVPIAVAQRGLDQFLGSGATDRR